MIIKYALVLILIAAAEPMAFSQQGSIFGIVSLQNSETYTGHRKYIANVQIEDDFNRANPTVSDQLGKFKLIYVGLENGRVVSFQAKKHNLEVVDIVRLNAVIGQTDPVIITMAHPDSINTYRIKLYKIAKTEAQKKLEVALTQKQHQLELLSTNYGRKEKEINDLQDQIEKLTQHIQKLDDLAQDLATRYSKINLDDISQPIKEAYHLFQNGYLDSSLALLNKYNYTSTVKDILDERNKIEQQSSELRFRDSIQIIRTKETTEALSLKTSLHQLRFENDSTRACLKSLLTLQPNNPIFILRYADFLTDQSEYDSATKQYNSALLIVKLATTASADANNFLRAQILNNLGICYYGQNMIPESINALKESLHQKYSTPSQLSDRERKTTLIHTLINLGLAYSKGKQFALATEHFNQGDSIAILLERIDASQSCLFRAKINNYLGVCQLAQNKLKDAEYHFQTAIEKEKCYLPRDSLFDGELAVIQNNLGIYYKTIEDFPNAERAYQQALHIYRNRIRKNPRQYEADLAAILDNLGVLYLYDSVQAPIFFSEALSIRKRLAEFNPNSEGINLLKTMNNIGVYYLKQKHFSKADSLLTAVISYADTLSKRFKRIDKTELAEAYGNLASLQAEQENFDSAIKSYWNGILMLDSIFKVEPTLYAADLKNLQNGLGKLYLKVGKFDSSEILLRSSIATFANQAETNGDFSDIELARLKKDLAQLLIARMKLNEADSLLVQASLLCHGNAQHGTKTFLETYAFIESTVGNLNSKLGRLSQVEGHFSSSAAAFRELLKYSPKEYYPHLAVVYNNLGYILLDDNKPDSALYYLQLSVAICNQLRELGGNIDPLNASNIHSNMGIYFARLGRYDSSEFYFRNAVKILNGSKRSSATLRDQFNFIIQNLLRLYIDISWSSIQRKEFKSAEVAAIKGLEVDSANLYLKILYSHALLFEGRIDEAFQHYKQIKNLFLPDGSSVSEQCLRDFDTLQAAGIISPDANSIRPMFQK